MKMLTSLLITTHLVACSSHTIDWSKPKIRVSPRMQQVNVGQRAEITITISGKFPPAVMEILSEDALGNMQVNGRSYVDGPKQINAHAIFTEEYYLFRSGKEKREQDFLSRDEPTIMPALPVEPWDGHVKTHVVLRAPKVDDFQGHYTKEQIIREFGRADGKVYAKTEFVTILHCPMCTA